MALKYIINLHALPSSDSFTEASREELRVLLALVADAGTADSKEALAKLSGVSVARTASALSLWEESGIIAPASEDDTARCAEIIDEFEERLFNSEVDEEASSEVARSIRDKGLRELIDECTVMMGRAALGTQEVKLISATVTQLALSCEYVLTLAAHLAEKNKLTAKRLSEVAYSLVGKGIDTLEDLERYIKNKENESGDEWEIRRLFGIYNRTLTKTEKHYFERWTKKLGYSVNIIGEAYDISVCEKDKRSLSYMDKLLSDWHEHGCKTAEECRARNEEWLASKQAERAEKKTRSSKASKREADTPRYADFDTEDALMRALERSYGKES